MLTNKPAVQNRIGQKAPDLKVQTLDGRTLTLAELRGKPVWLNFWVSSCAPCRAEMPELIAVGQEAGAEQVRLVALNMGETRTQVRGYLAESGYKALPVVLDSTLDATSAYRVYNLPTHVFIDFEGIVRRVHVGKMSASAMRAALQDLERH